MTRLKPRENNIYKKNLRIIYGLVSYLAPFQAEECEVFHAEYCSLRLDKILMLDTNLAGPVECQVGREG